MNFEIKVVEAKTHNSEYLLHKYWARKPSNVISSSIKSLLPKKGSILDPFCGSGVVLREGSLLGHEVTGIDINPVAVLITKVLILPPTISEFDKIVLPILDDVENKFKNSYSTLSGEKIKYVLHRIVSECKTCGSLISSITAEKRKSGYNCPNCGSQIRFNLESLHHTEVFGISVENNKTILIDEKELKTQELYSMTASKTGKYDFFFVENRRILSFEGIKTSHFFTHRNFEILSYLSDRFHMIENDVVRNAALLLLTASSAQCSRLIAHRNNLSTGGPAWSVPGFWVPQEHLETNPIVHLKARYKKFIKGLSELNKKKIVGNAEVIFGNSYEYLKNQISIKKYDLIFLDPPYGDSVPYTEFSAIWNSFLGVQPNFEHDLSVSDRLPKKISWENYHKMLHSYMAVFSKMLNNQGKLLITFNNNDLRAWLALLSSLQDNGFYCKSVIYQIPAVISSKAQFSPDASYISDLYSVFSLESKNTHTKDLNPVIKDLIQIANIRNGKVRKNIVEREFILSFLKHNVHHSHLDDRENLINSIFTYEDKFYVLKDEYRQKVKLLVDIIKYHIVKLTHNGPLDINDCYKKIAASLSVLSSIEYAEFYEALSGFIINKNKIYGCPEVTLFDI
ncbi:MAG: DNA methyltransferase [Cyclobacteriaceae bacterium]|nr:DNA methyltransferase [Cyclobacteriaceae bacterium]